MTYIGKRVQVNIPARDEKGRLNGKLHPIGGICQTEPKENKWLGIKLQVVVNRLPVSINSLNDIKIIE